MTDYIKNAVRTKSGNYEEIYDRIGRYSIIDLLHGAIGISTEAGELLDAFKKHIYYGKKLDITNVKEEIGDLFWYMAIICDSLDVSFEEIMTTNIKKLQARYPDKFNSNNAISRDLKKEREILEDAN